MNLSNTLFINNLPKIDLHGYDRVSASLAINDFIKENIKLRNEKFVIIHGIGSGILKKTTHETLRKNKNVIEYMVCYNNIGSTIVRVKI
ncbi:MAG: Smr/MutS family protein [Bacilli bacterium]|nr:Smr/MutS family protein [Bacilli bacterium]